MSVISAAGIGSPSILKVNKTLVNDMSVLKTPSRVRFSLPQTHDIRGVLDKYVNDIDSRDYASLIVILKQPDLSDDELISMLSQTRNCISFLNEKVVHYVEALLNLKWAHRDKPVVREYQKFIFDLLAAHNYYIKLTINKLVQNFVPDEGDNDCWNEGCPPDSEYSKFLNVHYVINFILKVIPMSHSIFLETLKQLSPYIKRPPHNHEVYLHNLLWILDYRPEFRPEILQIIFQQMIRLDVNAPRTEIEDAEEDENVEDENIFEMEHDGNVETVKEMKHPIAHSLDICLNRIFSYLHNECHNPDATGEIWEFDWDKAKLIYLDMIKIFEDVIMPVHDSHHVQFVMFYLCSFKITMAEAFLNFLWKRVCNLKVAVVHRQAAVSYLASFLARALYIHEGILKSMLEQIASWIHRYIGNQDGLETVNASIRAHAVFYSVCQCLFYVIAFRHKNLIKTKKNLVFMQSLNLSKIVTCPLNPLKFCIAPVVQNFAAVTRTYQLCYCYAIIEHNSRNSHPILYKDSAGQMTLVEKCLQSYFPFDPYLLRQSKPKIIGLYGQYQSLSEPKVDGTENSLDLPDECEDDDFLAEGAQSKKSGHDFTYGTSPGFKRSLFSN